MQLRCFGSFLGVPVILGFQRRLFAVSFATMVVAGAVSGLFLERGLRRDVAAAMGGELRGHADAVVGALGEARGADLDAFADRLGAATGSRVTLIDRAGVVVGDSTQTPGQLASLDNHGDRPEVQAAVKQGYGSATRYSRTLRRELFYVARSTGHSAPVAVVRVSEPLEALQTAVTRLRWRLLGAGFVLSVVALLISAVAAAYLSRALKHLERAARAVVIDRRRGHRLAVGSQDELGRLAGTFNRLLDDLESTMGDLRMERSRFEAVLTGMSEAVIALDHDGVITLSNPAAAELLGHRGTLEGAKLSAVLKGQLLDELGDWDGIHGPQSVEFELDGDPPRRILARKRLQDEDGGAVVVLLDVSRVRALEKVRKDFVANVSHELRTPVAVLQANAETLLDGALEEPVMARRFVEAIHRQARRLTALVNDLLDISRIEAGRYELKPERFALLPAVEQVLESIAKPDSAQREPIGLTVPPDLVGVSDPKAFDQILRNFLENAIKYTAEDAQIVVRAHVCDEGRVRIEVEDNGPGIAAKHRERLFERFYRVDKGRSRAQGGTGLGLSIAKHLAEAQNGSVGYEPAEPRGSVFWFELPAG